MRLAQAGTAVISRPTVNPSVKGLCDKFQIRETGVGAQTFLYSYWVRFQKNYQKDRLPIYSKKSKPCLLG